MKILFIGNSYTFFSDMPNLLEMLAKENGKDLICDSVTKGGRRLYQNLEENDENGKKIQSLVEENEYDALFLQEHSCFPILDYDKFLSALKTLKELVNAKRTILYATWGRKEGSETLTELKLTNKEMSKKLTDAYNSAAQTLDTEISHVGKVFLKISECLPSADIYKPDLSHPSYLGSVIVSICHYLTLFGEMPESVACFDVDMTQMTDIMPLILEAMNEN